MVRPLNCIAAVSQNMGIGKNGDLPWPPLRNEFKHFQRMTTVSSIEGKQNLVIMGRKTWFSLPEKNRPLKNRINIVLSRELKEPPQGADFLAESLDDALKLIEEPELTNKVDMVWIIGGSSVYKEAMNKPGHVRLFVTRIMQDFESDTYFPEIDLEKYKLLPEPLSEAKAKRKSYEVNINEIGEDNIVKRMSMPLFDWATLDLFSYEGHVDHFKVGFEPGVEGSREVVTENQEEGSEMLQAEGKQ